jgi:hypothetical protein
MAQRSRFRIMDLIVLIAASAITFGAVVALDRMNDKDQGKVAFWLVFIGVILVGYLAGRFARTPEVHLIIIGLAVAFAGAADAMFLDAYMDAPTAAVVACLGLTLASLVLLIGGIVHGLRARIVETLAGIPRSDDGQTDAARAPHPLDMESSK